MESNSDPSISKSLFQEVIFEGLKTLSDCGRILSKVSDVCGEVEDRAVKRIDHHFNYLDNYTATMTLRINEVVLKSANSINVVIRLLAGALKLDSTELKEILDDADAWTCTVEQNMVMNFEDYAKNVLINSGVSSTTSAVPAIAQTPSTSDVSSTQCENSVNLVNKPKMAPYIVNVKREKEKQEQEILRKKYRNKYNYLPKYMNNAINTKSTPDENKIAEIPHFSGSNANNVKISHLTETKSDSVIDSCSETIVNAKKNKRKASMEKDNCIPTKRVLRKRSNIK